MRALRPAPVIKRPEITAHCWFVRRFCERPKGVRRNHIAAEEVERISSPAKLDESSLENRGYEGTVNFSGSVLYLKDGGFAYSHTLPKELARVFGWQ